MKCSDCKRAMIKPALTIGAYVFGPICAKRYYVAPTRSWPPVPVRRASPPLAADPNQLALELDAA